MSSAVPLPEEESSHIVARRKFEVAVRTKRVARFVYDGDLRVVMVAAVGWKQSTRSFLVRAYQIGGTSSSGSIPEWRMFSLKKVQDLVLTAETFTDAPPGYNPFGDAALDLVYAKL